MWWRRRLLIFEKGEDVLGQVDLGLTLGPRGRRGCDRKGAELFSHSLFVLMVRCRVVNRTPHLANTHGLASTFGHAELESPIRIDGRLFGREHDDEGVTVDSCDGERRGNNTSKYEGVSDEGSTVELFPDVRSREEWGGEIGGPKVNQNTKVLRPFISPSVKRTTTSKAESSRETHGRHTRRGNIRDGDIDIRSACVNHLAVGATRMEGLIASRDDSNSIHVRKTGPDRGLETVLKSVLAKRETRSKLDSLLGENSIVGDIDVCSHHTRQNGEH